MCVHVFCTCVCSVWVAVSVCCVQGMYVCMFVISLLIGYDA